ncbi:MAG: riboflavin biosynthesis protein RibF [Phycisphaeraceae bacterium]|nr:riboflavin biosynthesis protein RibF [Phycisphaeraceae bacterium]MCP4497014.1 riboflavin biosynthesis protein RibF [Phycisphaeraceae bacterium]
MLGVTIGNFDGVHLGHRRLLEAVRTAVGPAGRVVAVTFDPDPARVLGHPSPDRLMSSSRRQRVLQRCGADDVLVLEATKDLLSATPEKFLDRLETAFGEVPAVMVEGPDFRFGHQRAAGVEELHHFGVDRGFKVRVEEEHRVRLKSGLEMPVRSSAIREMLRLGRVEDATTLLGEPHVLDGVVVQGDQRGRTIGIPTANLDLEGTLLPADGVYAGLATLPDGSVHPAAISIGTKPTFEETPRVAEIHVLDWAGTLDDYGWRLEATLVRRLRGQYRYDDLPSLLAQIDRDIAAVRRTCIESGHA